ncbi:MAG: hypothetical protein EBQ99_08770, partial [Planctomycetes bacterium]|nr:hypothetical protein [Planctomycetota bacterium]
MSGLPWWLMPSIAGGIAAVMVVLLSRADRNAPAESTLRREPVHESWWPSLLAGLAVTAVV